MADVVTSQTVFDGDRMVVMKFTDVSDGTGEAAVTKVQVSTLNKNQAGMACDRVSIAKIHTSIGGMAVNVQWGASSNVTSFILAAGVHTFNFDRDVALQNNAGAGITGDIKFTTIGAAANSTYSIVLELVKHYATPKDY